MFITSLRTLRRKHGLSQEELAEKLGVSRQAISKWENGSALPDLENLMAICSFFGITMDELIGNVMQKEVPSDAEAPRRKSEKAGIVLCLLSLVVSGIIGLLLLIFPRGADAVATSSIVRVNGLGICFLVAIFCAVFGVILFFWGKRRFHK